MFICTSLYNLRHLKEISLCNRQRLLQKRHNQSNCRVVERNPSGCIYNTVLFLRLSEHFSIVKEEAERFLRSQGSASLLWDFVSWNVIRYTWSLTNMTDYAWAKQENNNKHAKLGRGNSEDVNPTQRTTSN